MILPHNKLGSTDLYVSALGLGTVKFGRNTDVKYPRSFNLPDDKQITELLNIAKDLNINFLDTAPAYGTSEERLGNLLRGQRQNWILASKAGEDYTNNKSTHDFSARHIIHSIKRSLQRLNTDYIDLMLIHSDGDDETIIRDFDVFGTLQVAKKQGLIRAFGMSTKTLIGGMLTVQHADVAMVTCNANYTDEIPVISQAHALNKGILIKKSLLSGNIDKINSINPIQSSMQFVFEKPGVSSIVVGTINPQHLASNVQSAIQALAL